MLDISVVVPVRNAENVLERCLESISRSQPGEIIVVDGMSTDATLEIARRYRTRILSDGGRGLPVARLLGAEAATYPWVALIDADVVLPDGALERLFEEFISEGYTALQAGLHSVGESGYWGNALATHHRWGRSKHWFGLVATIFERQFLLEHGFDERFVSGEDIEMRWRLEQAGAKIGVSTRTIVTHRFESGFAFARRQWAADGAGLARMFSKHPRRGVWLLGLPLAGGVRGIGLSVVRGEPRWIPYFVCFVAFNYVAIVRELVGHRLRSLQAASSSPS
ncbi:MAG: glycosyltransferase [Actinobacteria bacterium]|nr:glycosyltransferase [Actinomycetota bacterium]